MTDQTNPVVLIQTTNGAFKVELWPEQAPETVKNFLRYVDEEYHAGTIFHRVIDGFMIQGGGLNVQMQPKQGRSPIKNEATAELKNTLGTIAMARTNQVNSATSQFFINIADNEFLDHKNATPQGFGYAVFGKVTEGMDVVLAIGKIKTRSFGSHQDVPVDPILIDSVTRVE